MDLMKEGDNLRITMEDGAIQFELQSLILTTGTSNINKAKQQLLDAIESLIDEQISTAIVNYLNEDKQL